MLVFPVISINLITIASLLKSDIFEPDEIKLNIGQMKINIGTPIKDGNVYFIENVSTDQDRKEFGALHLNNANTEKDQDQKFIWEKRRWEDKIPFSKNDLKFNYLINAEKKDNKQAQHPKDGESF